MRQMTPCNKLASEILEKTLSFFYKFGQVIFNKSENRTNMSVENNILEKIYKVIISNCLCKKKARLMLRNYY